jgi:hypothetical protein
VNDPKVLVLEYMDAINQQRFDLLEALLAPELTFTTPSTTRSTAREFLASVKRLTAIHVRNEVKRVFVDGDEVCVIYDFVTDTPAGALPAIEWLQIQKGRIRHIHLYYDRLPWKTVIDEMAQRAARLNA